MDESTIIELVQLAREGNRDAFGKLAQEFEPMIFGIVLRRLRNRSEAREITQDVLIQAMRKLSQLRDDRRFGAWLKQIAVRMSINRAVRRPNEITRSPETFVSLKVVPTTPLDHLLHAEQKNRVWGGLDRLRELDRETLIAFYVDGQSLKEMSDDFDSPIGTIKRRLHMARNRLRDELADLQPA